MYSMSNFMFMAALITAIIATIFYAVFIFYRRRVTVAGMATNAGTVGRRSVVTEKPSSSVGMMGTMFAIFTFVFLTLSMVFRAILTGHGPFSNMFEFSVSFAWGIVLAYLYVEARYRMRVLGVVVMPWAVALLAYAAFIPRDANPLVPALQNSLLLTVHVAVAIISYGCFAVAFGTAVLYLIQKRIRSSALPRAEVLDEVGYRTVMIGFPFMALVIILGALWADVAWGTYWSWDPKETASLVTWLLYGGYLHARVMRGWRGTRSAVLLLIGFGLTLFTFFGNLFFSGLHAYAGT